MNAPVLGFGIAAKHPRPWPHPLRRDDNHRAVIESQVLNSQLVTSGWNRHATASAERGRPVHPQGGRAAVDRAGRVGTPRVDGPAAAAAVHRARVSRPRRRDVGRVLARENLRALCRRHHREVTAALTGHPLGAF